MVDRTVAARGLERALRNVGPYLPASIQAWARVGGAFVVGGLAAWIIAPPAEGSLGQIDERVPVVELDGQPLPLTGSEDDTLDAARIIARRYVSQHVVLTIPQGEAAATLAESDAKRVPSVVDQARDDLGARIDPERLKALVRAVRDPRSALRRAHAGRTEPLRLPLPIGVSDERAMSMLLTLKDEFDLPPIDAKYSLTKGTIAADVAGRRLDVHATLARLQSAFIHGHGQVEAVVSSVPARRTAAMLGEVKVSDVLGYFETRYANDTAHADRTYNLRLAASRLDGHVILPGETFDFNEVVGPRSEAYGYRVATVIAQGELVDGIGGGTCQISGTLHGAAFFGGLDIVERKPHTRPSGYIKMGMDATVVYPTITLKLKNPFSHPVVLHEVVKDGVVRAEILGPKRTRDVTFVRRIDGVVPFKEREIPDPKIPKGEKVLAQRGIPGFKVTRYRVVRDGSFAVREKSPDYYPPTQQIVRVGTGEKNPDFVPRDDNHAEYVADELLTISQGPSIRNNWSERGGGVVESRRPGRYGSYGWTVREGFATEWKREPKRPDDDNPGVD